MAQELLTAVRQLRELNAEIIRNGALNRAAAGAGREYIVHCGKINELIKTRLELSAREIKNGAEISRLSLEQIDKAKEYQDQARMNERIDEAVARWVGAATAMADVTRNTLGRAVSELGQGVAGELVDGTNDWNRAGKNVLKTFIALTIQMAAMAAALAAIKVTLSSLTGGSVGFGSAFLGALGVGHKGTPGWPRGTDLRRFHSGGYLGKNEYLGILEGGEGVINRRAMERPGMREFVSDANRGGTHGSGTDGAVIHQHFHDSYSIQIQALDARDMDRVMREEIIPRIRNEQRRGYFR